MHCYENSPLIINIVSPYTMHGIATEGFSIYQATRIGFIIWIIFNKFANEKHLKHGCELVQ